MRELLVVSLVACGGGASDRDAGASPVTPPRDAVAMTRDTVPPPAPTQMLAPQNDPWGPNGPRPPERPRSKVPLPPKPAHDAPDPAEREVVLLQEGRSSVRVHLPIGNWYENRAILLGGASPLPWVTFNPSWHEGNIDLVLEVGCSDVCGVKELAADIARSARDDFEGTANLVPRWIVAPHQVSGVWNWRFEARDKIGTRLEGEVAVFRVIPELGAYLKCTGKTTRRANPVWLDRLEAICRQMTFEVLP